MHDKRHHGMAAFHSLLRPRIYFFHLLALQRHILERRIQLLSLRDKLIQFRLLVRQESLCGILRERALDHFLNLESLDAKQVEDHAVSNAEL